MARPALSERPPRPGGTPVRGKPAGRGGARQRQAVMAGGPRSRAHASRLALVIVLCLLPIGLMALPTTILFIVGMIPTMVALVADRDPEKYAPMIVGSLNFCGVMPFAISLWRNAHTIGHALRLLSDPYTWLVMYSAAALGWVLFYGVPPTVTAIIVFRNEAEIKRMKDRQTELVEEWGPEVAGTAPEQTSPE